MLEQSPKTPRQLSKQAEAMYKKHDRGRSFDEDNGWMAGGIPVSELDLKEASEHYRDNAAMFHKLGILEAAMDGVQIQVQHIESQTETIDVHRS